MATVISKAIGNDNEFKVALLAVNALSQSVRRRAKFTLICFRLMYQKFAKNNAYRRHFFFFSLLKAVQNLLKILPVPFTMLINRACWDWWTKLSAYDDADVTNREIRFPREVEKKPWERGWTRFWCPRWNPLVYIVINLNFALKLLGQFASEKECLSTVIVDHGKF